MHERPSIRSIVIWWRRIEVRTKDRDWENLRAEKEIGLATWTLRWFTTCISQVPDWICTDIRQTFSLGLKQYVYYSRRVVKALESALSLSLAHSVVLLMSELLNFKPFFLLPLPLFVSPMELPVPLSPPYLGLLNQMGLSTSDLFLFSLNFASPMLMNTILPDHKERLVHCLASEWKSFQSNVMIRPSVPLVYNHEETCSLPRWLLEDHHQFQNLNQTMTYHFNQPGTSLTVTSLEEQTERKLKCNTIVDDRPMEARAKVVMQVNFEW